MLQSPSVAHAPLLDKASVSSTEEFQHPGNNSIIFLWSEVSIWCVWVPTWVSLELCLVWYLFLRWTCVCAGVHPSDHWAGTTTCRNYNTPLLYRMVTTIQLHSHPSVTFYWLLLEPNWGHGRCWRPEVPGWEAGHHPEQVTSALQENTGCTVRGDSGSPVCMLWEVGMKSVHLGKTDTEKPKMIWYWRVQFFLVRRWKSTVYPGNLVHRRAASLVVSDLFVWNPQWTVNLIRQSLWIIKLYP